MPRYGHFCPVALATEVLADRWTPLIVRDLLLGNTRFNELSRGLPGISRSLLAQRLRHLERKGVLERAPSPTGQGAEYVLTPAGRELEAVIEALGRWAVEWQFDVLRPQEIDPVSLVWLLHRRVDPERVPPGRVVVEFAFTGPERQTFWLVIDRGEASVCLHYSGFDSDVVVTTTTGALAEVFHGIDTWAHATASGAIEVCGPPRLLRSLPGWFRLSPFAEATSARLARGRPAPAPPTGARTTISPSPKATRPAPAGARRGTSRRPAPGQGSTVDGSNGDRSRVNRR